MDRLSGLGAVAAFSATRFRGAGPRATHRTDGHAITSIDACHIYSAPPHNGSSHDDRQFGCEGSVKDKIPDPPAKAGGHLNKVEMHIREWSQPIDPRCKTAQQQARTQPFTRPNVKSKHCAFFQDEGFYAVPRLVFCPLLCGGTCAMIHGPSQHPSRRPSRQIIPCRCK